MKKILSLIIAFVLIFSCLAITVFAEDIAIEESYEYIPSEDVDIFANKEPKATFSEDYKKLYIDGEPFSRIDSSMLLTDASWILSVDEIHNEEYDTGNDIYVELTDAQKNEVKSVEFERNYHCNIYRASINFNDGSMLTVTFLKDTYLEEYNQLLKGETSEYEINFLYPDGNIVKTDKYALSGKEVMFNKAQLEDFNDIFDVTTKNADGSIVIAVGLVIRIGDNYYYADYSDLGIQKQLDWVGMSDLADKPIYRITDEFLLNKINEAQESYFDDDFGVLYDEDAGETISKAFFAFLFFIVPLALFVIFLVKAIKGKGTYKKLYITIASLCMATVIVFVILAVIVGVSGNSSESLVGGVDDSQLSADTFLETNDDTTTLELLELMVSDADTVMVKKAEYCGNMDCPDGCLEGTFCIRKDYAVDEAMSQFGIGEPDGNYKYYNEKTMETSIITDMIEYENGYLVEYKIISVG